MNAIVPASFQGQVSTVFAGRAVENDLSAGVQGGFGLIGYRGKVWSIRHRGEERQLMRDDGDGPRNSIEVVILKGSGVVSKIFYEAGWVEGSNAPPDCFSTNGVTPDISAGKKMAPTCAVCPKNAWGSRITPQGKQGKACSDSKRLAVVPLADIPNELFGGPMLLRVPAASLQDLATFGDTMAKLGYPYYAIGTRISFDPAESYPKFVFAGIRPLTDAEAKRVVEMQDDPAITRILAECSELVPAQAPQAALADAFEQPPTLAPVVVPQPAPVQQPVASAGGFGAAAPVAQAQAAPVQAQAGAGGPGSSASRQLRARPRRRTRKAPAEIALGGSQWRAG